MTLSPQEFMRHLLHVLPRRLPPDPALRVAAKRQSARQPGAGARAPLQRGTAPTSPLTMRRPRRHQPSCARICGHAMVVLQVFLRGCSIQAPVPLSPTGSIIADPRRRPWRPGGLLRALRDECTQSASLSAVAAAQWRDTQASRVVGAVCGRRRAQSQSQHQRRQSPVALERSTVAFAAVSSPRAYATPARTQRGRRDLCARGQVSRANLNL